MKVFKRIGVDTQVAEVTKKSVKDITLRTRKEIDVCRLIPSPCTPFNLECSGHIEGAFLEGTVANIIGDSHAGKTLFCLSIFAKCSLLPRYDDFRFIFDDVEVANEFDTAYLFGEDCHNRIETDIISKTIEQLGDNIARLLKGKKKFICVVDSADALTSEAAEKLAEENLKKREKGSDPGGSYGDGKARAFSDLFKRHIQALHDHGSTLIIISQTRDNIGFGAMFNPKVRSCGKALKFYSFHEIWLAMQKKEKKGSRTVLTNVQAKISKNKLTGRHGEALFPILFDFGVDNIASCINFLIVEKHWTKNGSEINTNGFCPRRPNSKKEMKHPTYNQLVEFIEQNNKERELDLECKKCYDAVIEDIVPKHRKFPYQRA